MRKVKLSDLKTALGSYTLKKRTSHDVEPGVYELEFTVNLDATSAYEKWSESESFVDEEDEISKAIDMDFLSDDIRRDLSDILYSNLKSQDLDLEDMEMSLVGTSGLMNPHNLEEVRKAVKDIRLDFVCRLRYRLSGEFIAKLEQQSQKIIEAKVLAALA